MSEDWHKASDGAADLRQQVAQDLGSEQDDDLNARLKAAGMYSIPEMMGETPLSRWTVQAGMTDLTFFEKWLERRLAQSLRMRVGYELGDNALNDAFKRFKDLADKKKVVYDEDIEALVDQEIAAGPAR